MDTHEAPIAAEVKPDRVTMAAFAGMVLCAGGSPVAVRFTLELGPFFSASIRLLGGSVILLAVVAAKRMPLPRGRALVGVVLFGLTAGFAFYSLVYIALAHVGAARAAPVMASVPLLTLFFAVAHRVERFRIRGLIGALTSVVGIVVLTASGAKGGGSAKYLLLVLAASALAAEAGIAIKKFPRVHPITMNAIAMGLGGALLLGMSFVMGERHALPHLQRSWLGLGYLVVFGSAVLFVLYVTVVERWTVTGASYQFVLFPIISMLLAGWIGHEPITATLVSGGTLVLVGVYIGALSGHRMHLHRQAVAPAMPQPAPPC